MHYIGESFWGDAFFLVAVLASGDGAVVFSVYAGFAWPTASDAARDIATTLCRGRDFDAGVRGTQGHA